MVRGVHVPWGILAVILGSLGLFFTAPEAKSAGRTDRHTKPTGVAMATRSPMQIGERCLYHLPNMNLIGQRGPELWRNLLNFYHYL